MGETRVEEVAAGHDDHEPLVRRVRCSGCAFTPGTEASENPLTRVKADACARLGVYFYCHRDALDTRNVGQSEALCAGWLQEVTRRLADGSIERLNDEERGELSRTLEGVELVEEHILGRLFE